MDELLKSLGFIAIAVASLFLKLFVLKKIWALTIMSLGAPSINYWQIYGIMIFVGTMTGQYRKDERSIEDKCIASLVDIMGLFLSWGIAYWIFG